MTPIIQAMNSGYSEQEILKYLSKASPSLAKSIAKATSIGYPVSQILGFLSKTIQDDEQINPYLSQEAAHKKVSERRAKLTKNLVKTGLGAIGTYGAARALPAAIQGIAGAFKPTPTPSVGPSPMSNAPVKPPPIPKTPPPVPASAANPATSPTQPPIPTPQQQPSQQSSQTPQPSSTRSGDSARIIESMNIGPQIQTLHNAGNSPETISEAIGVSLKPHQKKWLEEEIKSGKAKPLKEMIYEYVSQFGSSSKPNEKIVQKQQPEVQEEKKLQKEDLVAGPGGFFGNIKANRNGQSLVDVAGKIHQISTGALIPSPIPEKDLAELHEDLIRGIEKHTGEQVSRNVNWAGYDPNTNTLAYLPHGGGLYTYEEISPEDATRLTSVLQQRRTSGENFIGVWIQGTTSPIGSAMSDLIEKLQSERGGKGNEYSHKFETVYSAIEPASKAARKKKQEERRKNKKAKNER